jgi:TonB family protein
MSPVSLLFSSDEESSSRLVQALRELELETEPCPDIFTAVEWLTSRTFDVIVADLDSGPEAAFLLKNARELKLNKTAFTLALRSGTSNLAVDEYSADLTLNKPLIPDQIKYALLANDRFLACMRAWVARGAFAPAREATPAAKNAKNKVENIQQRRPQLEQPSPMPLAARPVEPSPAPVYTGGETSAPLNLTFATLDRRVFRSIGQRNRGERVAGKRGSRKFLWGTILSLAFVAVGCVFGQPLRVESVFASVATAYRQALEMKSSKLPAAQDTAGPDPAALAQAAPSQPKYPRQRVRTVPDQPTAPQDLNPEPPAVTLQADAHPDQDHLPSVGTRVLIPESLRLQPAEPATAKTASLKRSPSLLSQVEPVSLPEELAQALLLDKVQPSYPEQALKAGLQGAVVLQAWIGKDGNIQDLKLVNGSLLLGKAAVNAVKQWRYKPYLRNGVAVEAETYVTVNFKLP